MEPVPEELAPNAEGKILEGDGSPRGEISFDSAKDTLETHLLEEMFTEGYFSSEDVSFALIPAYSPWKARSRGPYHFQEDDKPRDRLCDPRDRREDLQC